MLFIAPQARLLFTFLPLPITSYHPSPLSPLKQVAIEVMDEKTFDLSSTVQMDPPDLKRLQLLLQGSISTQVRPPSYTIFVGEGILYEMEQIECSVCSLAARPHLAFCCLLYGNEREGIISQEHDDVRDLVPLFHSCRSTKECRSTPSSSVSPS